MEEVIEEGLWLFQGQPIVLQKWEPGMVLHKLQHTQVSVWIKLRHLPIELWTNEGLSTVASGIGKPLYPDAITRACTRLNFTRVCVMLDISSKLPKHIVIMAPREDGSESACKVNVEYEWLPPKCNTCMSLGHSMKGCPTMKLKQPAVSVYVQKPVMNGPVLQNQVHRKPVIHAEPNAKEASPDSGSCLVDREDKAILNVRGLNRRDHQVSVNNLVSEHRLQFISLLETRVSAVNVTRVQQGMLPRWHWYVDYTGPGNRIWLSWDDDFIGMDVLDVGAQCVHCKVYIRCIHAHVLMTIVYGKNDVVGRRRLWADHARISQTVRDTPWLVGGNFNTVLDVSEVCGHSGDIRGVTKEFQKCLQDTGLITLPTQGEWFSWHNCSSGSRSLWKRLDQLLRIWQHRIVGTTMFAVTRKLKALKSIFRAQRQKKGDLSNNVKLAASFLDAAQNLLAQDRLSPLFLHLEFCCKMILRLATKLEQNMLHQRAKLAWMKGRDQCSRIFFRKVAQRCSSKRIFQITDSTGQVLTTQPEVFNEFITYYQTLLGGERRNRMIDLCYLRPWARHVISEDEALLLVQPVTPDEIKQAVFDIDKVKAPGPDGYSSGFFKAAWPIVGEEVTRAIMEFFVTGRILKQVNSTLISLILRMRGVLEKLISPSQNAFVPGRSIGDNILLAQELFNGYNQQYLPPRCALKVDLRKAYDTVEWDFLSAVLTLFGFPEQFIL
ncbi:UNVERIFIED_CONTAM: hypothetical protein Slati_2471200 [Sesamum latifolium]|uniref:Reverse transcriptase domain-containing protein n=1 Tax=Sesamum latifolium TaxID=2727402 RepID=A0AAW2WDY1_9LAMI